MIDLIDVQNALVTAIVNAVYPTGTANPSVTGNPVRIFAGWPEPEALARDLRGATANVSVYPLPMERNTTTGAPEWITAATNAPTLTVSVAGQSVTIGGTVSVPQNVMIAVNGKPYSYGVQAADTTASIASSLAALISADIAATASGSTVTIATAIRIKAAIGVQGIAVRELRRQAKHFQICIWAAKPDVRDTLAANIDIALAKIPRLALQYGFAAHLTYRGSRQFDDQQNAGIYRRDLMIEADFPTIETETETAILGIADNLSNTINGVSVNTRTVWSI